MALNLPSWFGNKEVDTNKLTMELGDVNDNNNDSGDDRSKAASIAVDIEEALRLGMLFLFPAASWKKLAGNGSNGMQVAVARRITDGEGSTKRERTDGGFFLLTIVLQ